ncbi:hypothetical protein BCR34DRAFT_371248 [Clohesyomyces aquaticus]|uniref:Uncharacterized protein n=1 Tax=Clohesyomyces aquaticus TaxID=1231657 RepID=A0A1Y1ZGP9_9PLEO|nr:hypothetical protein BCR34DRAFT_371248 [Clohesyomyces aquaticus]
MPFCPLVICIICMTTHENGRGRGRRQGTDAKGGRRAVSASHPAFQPPPAILHAELVFRSVSDFVLCSAFPPQRISGGCEPHVCEMAPAKSPIHSPGELRRPIIALSTQRQLCFVHRAFIQLSNGLRSRVHALATSFSFPKSLNLTLHFSSTSLLAL